MTEFRVRIDAEKATQEFKEARREVNSKAREGIIKAGEQAILPSVRDRSPSIVRPWLTVRATARRGYITVAGERKRDRITGLLNFGGRVTTPIRPLDPENGPRALTIPGVGFRASVTKPRIYPGMHFLEAGVEAAQPEFERILLTSVMHAFDGLDHVP